MKYIWAYFISFIFSFIILEIRVALITHSWSKVAWKTVKNNGTDRTDKATVGSTLAGVGSSSKSGQLPQIATLYALAGKLGWWHVLPRRTLVQTQQFSVNHNFITTRFTRHILAMINTFHSITGCPATDSHKIPWLFPDNFLLLPDKTYNRCSADCFKSNFVKKMRNLPSEKNIMKHYKLDKILSK